MYIYIYIRDVKREFKISNINERVSSSISSIPYLT